MLMLWKFDILGAFFNWMHLIDDFHKRFVLFLKFPVSFLSPNKIPGHPLYIAAFN
jgi:hypothetical protein